MPMSAVARRALALAVAVLLALAGTPRPALADDALTVIGASEATGFFEILLHVAEHAGFFTAEHLAVTVQYVTVGGSSAAAQLVASGKADVAELATEPLLQGYQKGLRLEGFLSRDPRYQWVLAVLDDSPIKTLADFKGATLGEMSVGSPSETEDVATLGGAGLKRGDWTYLPVGHGATAITAFTSKKVDGASFPYVELASYEVNAHIKFRYFWNPILKDIGDVTFAALPATIASKSDQLQRFCRAIVMASILIRENPPLAARYYLEGAAVPVTPEHLSNEIQMLSLSQDQLPGIDPTNPKIGEFSLNGLTLYMKYLVATGQMSQVVPASSIVTNQFVGYANDFDHKAFIAQVKKMH
jgi:NitT/TauT family transport system substrate-binding protein